MEDPSVRFQTAGQFKALSMRRLSLPAMTVGVLLLAGCGGSSSSTTSSSAETAPATETSTAATTASESTAASETTSSASAAPATTPSAGGGSSLSLAANPEGQLSYNTKSLSAKAGKVSIAFTNSSPEGHNVTIASSSGAVVGSTPTFQGGSKTLSVTLKPGTYKFYCSVPGHRMAGMEGTLTVK
jgi:plastocyanin